VTQDDPSSVQKLKSAGGLFFSAVHLKIYQQSLLHLATKQDICLSLPPNRSKLSKHLLLRFMVTSGKESQKKKPDRLVEAVHSRFSLRRAMRCSPKKWNFKGEYKAYE
jgi:hypothetical protein